jgi:hypothetical protein
MNPQYSRFFTFLLMFLAATAMVRGDTTVPITGIGTSLSSGLPAPVLTHVDSVTYAGPNPVTIHGMPVLEIRGTVSGVGWGGLSLVPRAVDAHYKYEIPFVARWRADQPARRLVFYNHGGGTNLIGAVKRDKLSGATNPNRTAELNGDLLVGVPALLDQATYISINRRGLRADGSFCATYFPPIAPLDANEVNIIIADIATAPGPASYSHPGIAVGAPAPALPTNDAPTFRDIARALEQVVSQIQGITFQTRIGVGTSSGARLFAALNFGRTVKAPQSLRTGGNRVMPYDINTPRIFDGFILNGFTYIPDVEHADSAFPFSAPVMLLQGQGDERYQQTITLAHELLRKGVMLNGQVWIYEIKNLTHVPRDITQETTNPSDGDRAGCFVSAAIRNMRAKLETNTPPPHSRIAGRLLNGVLRIPQAGNLHTGTSPVPHQPPIDKYVVDPMLVERPIGRAETVRWWVVTAALRHVNDAITPPTVSCRLGGYTLRFFGSQLTPFPPAQLAQRFGCFDQYQRCVADAVRALEQQRLYDSNVESAAETAERARALLPACTPAHAATH